MDADKMFIKIFAKLRYERKRPLIFTTVAIFVFVKISYIFTGRFIKTLTWEIYKDLDLYAYRCFPSDIYIYQLLPTI